MKKRIKVQPTTRQKYNEFVKMATKNGYYNGYRYGWGFSTKEEKIVDNLKNDPDVVILRMPPEEIGKFEALYPNIVISDKYKYITTVADEHLIKDFARFLSPDIEIVQ